MTLATTTARLLSIQAALRKDQINGLKKQYKLSEEEILKCNGFDPSPKCTYTGWLCKIYAHQQGAEADKDDYLQKLKFALIQFMKLCNNPDFPKDQKDIGKYSAPQLMNLVGNQRRYLKNLSPTAIAKLIKTEGLPGAKIIWNGSGFRMWYVTNPEYAVILSSNTGWCTAHLNHAQTYTLRGGLYTIYLNGKPFLQGHTYFTGDGGGEVQFLDVKDESPDILNPDLIRAFEIIQHPVMDILKRKCDRDFGAQLYNMTQEAREEKRGEIFAYVDMTRHISLVLDVVRYLWWEDGWEVLLDSPTYLMNALESVSTEVREKLRNSSFASDIADICTDKGNLKLALMYGGDRTLVSYVHKIFDEREGMAEVEIFSTSNFNDEQNKLIEEEATKQVASLTSELKASKIQRLNYLGFNTVVAYWKKFVNQYWNQFDRFLADSSSEYVERVNIVKPLTGRIKLKVDDLVGPGPDCTISFKQGVVTEVEQEERPKGTVSKIMYNVEFKDSKSGAIHRIVQDLSRGVFPLIRVTLEGELVPMIFFSTTLEAGQKVVPGYNSSRAEGSVGEVVEVDADSSEYKVEWDNGDTQWYNYKGQGAEIAPAVPSSDPQAVTNWETDKDDPELKVGDYVMIDPAIVRRRSQLHISAGKVEMVDKDGTIDVRTGRTVHNYSREQLLKMKAKPTKGTPLAPQPVALTAGMRVIPNPRDWPYGTQQYGRGDNRAEEGSEVIGEVVGLEDPRDEGHENMNTTYLVLWPNSDGHEGFSGNWDYQRQFLIAVT